MKKPAGLFILIIAFCITGVTVPAARAQIHLGGLLDMELRKGGKDSSPYVNQTPNDKWTMYMPYIRLFADGVISDHWFVSAALQSDYYDGRHLSPVFFSVLNANWIPKSESRFMITLGRFVTPYGTYSDRILSSENPFVHLPLSHASGLPISKTHGILSNQMNYGYVPGLTMVYQRMYAQGIKISNQVGESNWLQYDLAATLAPASSHFEVGEHSTPAFTGRVSLHPKIWGWLGFSFSTGSFMKRDAANQALTDSDLSSYQQLLLGADLKLSYHYYTFVAEYNWSRWKAPYIDPQGTVADDDLETRVNHLSAEAMVNFPFWVGGYAALRYETLLSGRLMSNTGGYNNVLDQTWTYDRERIEGTLGYKIERSAILKLSYLYSSDSGPGLDDDVLSLQLSLGF